MNRSRERVTMATEIRPFGGAPSEGALRDFAESAKAQAVRVLADDVTTLERSFFDLCDGNLAEFAIARRLPFEAVAAQLRMLGVVSGHDIRCVAAAAAGPATEPVEMRARFRALVGELGDGAVRRLPAAMRQRIVTAVRLADAPDATVSQIAVAADAIAQGLDRGGDRRRALDFALLGRRAVTTILAALRGEAAPDAALA